MFLLITGNGKGKTTSAIGTAIRGIGWGKKVAMILFDKGGSHYGEQHIFDFLQEKIDVFRFGQKRFDEKKQTFRFEHTQEDYKEAEKALEKIRELLLKNYFLIIADEIVSALNLRLIKESDVRSLVDYCPLKTHLLFTGRNAPKWLIKKANLVSEIKEVKHYYKKTKKTIKGIDY
ncbi:MAG: cob(I)yrinic acid a,c-diamide adenosyltransferase [Candidatus Magasanikbacteria bacterium]|nr:cob(I)yrinic acid a,c-diamide adenosyltransferase [Candidatus Magasanikbacteria bacterium]